MVKIKNLHKSFEELTVLDGVSLHVENGQNMVVFGRSGTGKSVLLKCLIRLMEPDSGEIYVEGHDVRNLDHKSLNELRKDMGFLFQSA
jgi:phospholipid/cholesterol/gamma-HCH transport system ATP-binding protein